MAIRKDIDDMLNILKTGQNPEPQPKKQVQEPIRTRHDSEIDNMSVDDLLTSLTAPKAETANEPKIGDEPDNKTVIQEEITVNTESKPKKKKIVITGELPDYEALRAKELEHDRLERERIEAEKRAAEKAERERIKAEKARAEAEKKAAEEAAEAARIEAERKAENARLEAERRAMEQARLEAQRKAAEEARLEEERRAAEEARLEEERRAAEEARLEEERRAAEEARLEEERRAAEEARLEEERRAAEEARLEEERRAAEEARLEEERRAAEKAAIISVDNSESENSAEETLSEPTLDELMDAAIAAAKAEEEKFLAAERAAQELSEYDPVENMIGNIREDAEKAAEEIEELHEEPEQTEKVQEEAPPSLAEIEAELDDELFGKKKNKKKRSEKNDDSEEAEQTPKKQGKIASALENILDEDPDEIIAHRSETTEPDETENYSGGKLKKTLYTVFGVIFFLLACIGLITVIAKAIGFFGSYASGDTQKGSFKEVLYPAVIMDIESFNEPAELPSDQILTAAIWSMIMSDSAMEDYEQTFDVVKIPAADVESYAVKLFGENIPELNHTTVGPAESRFYYNEETKSYNVPVAPVTYTYAPSVRSATKNGSNYTVVVDYIDELPEWLPETSSKSVEFTLTETGEGYMLKAMKILSTTSNSL